ncbi:hypothetical protein HYDPIDRAFT_32692 [Hydnomerulius pinastri MD-312]|uniref:Uncharacterized protein n=1 Tax=Hydnomerulius pinastri MD-312 TaxID=994086 RepID=A0A0C9WA53_9AGAM|nr:hypothetical protein HYDPIDRAFT_32692 [Hydnomerulius pinastri MD-312]
MAKSVTAGSGLVQQPFHFDKSFVVLSDWDGTITTCDSNDYITDNYGMGFEGRVGLNKEILEFDTSGGKTGKSFKDAFEDMLNSVSAKGHSLDACKTYLTTRGSDGKRPVDFTDGFIDFKRYCNSQGIPFTIVSSGMDELIRAVLNELASGDQVSEEAVKDITIVSNGVMHDGKGNNWHVIWRHPESSYGHDKSKAILPYKERRQLDGKGPLVFFFGDGVSDLSAAQHADVLFVKVTGVDEKDNLKKHCEKAGIAYIPFLDFTEAQGKVNDIVTGKKQKEELQVLAKSHN